MANIKMTTGQAIVKFLENQYISLDGVENKFVDGYFTIFGHGIVVGLGEALEEKRGEIKVYQGKNEQGMAHVAMAIAKQSNRTKIIPCASSIGPGSANMVTAAACATVNNIPLLLFCGDSFATRQPDPVLQQIEQSHNLTITTNDAFKPVTKYWDRITRPQQIMTALINAMRVLTDIAETGAVCIALPQDVQGESYEYPHYFFEKRVHKISRTPCEDENIQALANVLSQRKKPIVICGGGVRYSKAGKTLSRFCEKFNIPMAETQAGKSACKSSHEYNLGGVGVTGNSAANDIIKNADFILAIGTRLSDFTTSSKSFFSNENVKIATINASKFHALKADALACVGDAKTVLLQLEKALETLNYKAAYSNEIENAKQNWQEEMKRLAHYKYDENFKPLVNAREEKSIDEFAKLTGCALTQTEAICAIREHIAHDSIITGASGSLPGDLQRMWETDATDSYHMEYGYSCMGYEISSALGAKLAEPTKEVYSMLGDGSYLMLHSELVTSLQENKKINVLLFDNAGFGCINNLQMGSGIGNFMTEFRYADEKGEHTGDLMHIDYAKSAAGYGVKTYTAKNMQELLFAIEDAKKQSISTLIDIKVLPKTMTDGYGAWWHVGIASSSKRDEVLNVCKKKDEMLKITRKY